jgi:Na+-transporting methylmalonyl-CoA/oxaloacetate decarboxylase gamma subunit
MASLFTLGLGVALYIPYALLSVTGPSGGSVPGLIYAGLGSAMMLFAGLLGARKKVRIWRLGRATWWMRGHLWIGFLSFPFILFHSGFQLGNGALTKVLMVLFLVVFVSGVVGAAVQHFMPRMITERVPMETIYEQIDRILEQLVNEAGAIVAELRATIEEEVERVEADEELFGVSGKARTALAGTMTDERVSKKITSFFESQMKPYLRSRQSRKHRLDDPVQTSVEFQQFKVLVPKTLWPKFDDLENICTEKRQLERQRMLHKFLHGWLLFHIPASYALLLLGAVHAVMALRY